MDLSTPQAVAAVVAGCVSLITALVTALITVRLSHRREKLDERLAALKADLDRELAGRRGSLDERLTALKAQFEGELAVQRARLDNRDSYAAEQVAHALLMHPQWRLRSFSVIKSKLGGFEEERLRRILVQAGAVRFIRGADNVEYWGLLDRNQEVLE